MGIERVRGEKRLRRGRWGLSPTPSVSCSRVLEPSRSPLFSPLSTLNLTLCTSLPPASCLLRFFSLLSQDHPYAQRPSILSGAGQRCHSARTGLLAVRLRPRHKCSMQQFLLLSAWLLWILNYHSSGSFSSLVRPNMFCANSPSHLSLALGCRTVLFLITPLGVPTNAWPSSDLHPM